MEALKNHAGLLSLTQLASILSVHRTTLYNWTKQGKIPSIRVGSRLKYDPARISKWLQAVRLSERKFNLT